MAKGKPFGLFVFSTPDTHIHIAADCTRPNCGTLAHAISVSLRRKLKIETCFAPVYVGEIRDAKHLYSTFHYVLRQQRRHELSCDPFHEGSNLPDLLGLRVVGRYTIGNVRRLLPRINRMDLLGHIGLDDLRPTDNPIGCLELLPRAAVMAAGLSHLKGSSAPIVDARRAIVEIAFSHVPVSRLMDLLSLSRRSIYRLREDTADPPLVYATRLQLSLLRQKKAALSQNEPFLAPQKASQ
jgi:hypothetical protein